MLKLEEISKSYGKNEVLKEITYDFKEKGLYVLSGENGSGKSTLIKLISSFIYKNKGTITAGGEISMLPERFSFPPFMSSVVYLNNIFILNGYDADAKTLLAKYQVPEKKIYSLSKGNRQKLGIIQALSSNAAILILDEPTDGLDEASKKIFKEDIITLSKEKLVIVSIHNKSFFNDTSAINLELKEGVLVEKKKRKKATSTV